jgi:RNA polymerase sigma-70 factor (ECF subfamily)
VAAEAREVFEILIREHARELDLFLRALVRDDALAEDLLQETLLVAWRRLGDFDRRRPFGAWLRGIAGRLALAERRRRARAGELDDERVLELLDARFAALHALPGDDLDERLGALEECLAQLPARMRSALELRYVKELGGDALAALLETSAAAARKLLQRARERVARCLDGKLAPGGGTA